MDEYIECRNCGFVLAANGAANMSPKHWGSCPDCDGTRFEPVT